MRANGIMSRTFAALLAAALLGAEALGKTVTGLFKSEVARQHSGQFIAAFMYQGSAAGADVSPLTCHLSADGIKAWCSLMVLT